MRDGDWVIAHMITVEIVVFGGGRTVMSVSVVVTVSTSYKTMVGLRYCVQKALALCWYAERVRRTASVTQA